MDMDKTTKLLETFHPDTDNLIVVGVIAVIFYAFYVIGTEASRLADTAIGGLIGYLGASAKVTKTTP
jgi:hypothetical protein